MPASIPDLEGFYSVESLDELIGNDDAIDKITLYADEIDRGVKRKPLLLYGPSGIGKTTAAELIARKKGWGIIELNAGDYRDKETITAKLLPAATSSSLFHKRNMILLDEIDELAMRFDKGASSAILDVLERTKQPMIFTANDMWDQKIAFLRNRVEPVEFKKIGYELLIKLLSSKCKRYGLHVSKENIEAIARIADGDARSALNDLYAIANLEADALDVIGIRDRKRDIFETLDRIFLSNSYAGPLLAISSTDVSNDMLVSWLEENIPFRYRHLKDLSNALEMLSLGSMYYNSASSSQYYIYWRYANAFISSGIALAKGNMPDTTHRYVFPRVIKALSASKEGRNRIAIIAKKLQRTIHSSRKRIINSEIHIIAKEIREAMRRADKEEVYSYVEYAFGLSKEDQDYLAENA
ncbi:MAG: replication factor C large subunit [Candidatus Micrarchaeia archaeon]